MRFFSPDYSGLIGGWWHKTDREVVTLGPTATCPLPKLDTRDRENLLRTPKLPYTENERPHLPGPRKSQMPSSYVASIHGHVESRPAMSPLELREHEQRILAHQQRILREMKAETLIHDGCEFTYDEWAELTSIPASVIRNRIAHDWPIADALTIPPGHNRAKKAGVKNV